MDGGTEEGLIWGVIVSPLLFNLRDLYMIPLTAHSTVVAVCTIAVVFILWVTY